MVSGLKTHISGRYQLSGLFSTGKSISGIRSFTSPKLRISKIISGRKQERMSTMCSPTIISQELWDSVQKHRKRVQRASAWGSHSHRLSGYLYCADCGRRMTLQTHYSRTDGSVQYSFRCGDYSRRTDSCTAHGISAEQVETLIANTIKRITRRVLDDERAFAEEIQSRWNAQQEAKPQQKKSDIKQL